MRKPKKIWLDKGSEFYNISFKKWLEGNDIEIYSTHSEAKSIVAERLTRTFKFVSAFFIKFLFFHQMIAL